MVSFNLDELTDTALRRAASELQIDLPAGTQKAEVIAAIKAKVSADSPLVLSATSLAPEKKGWRSPTVFVAILSLCVALSSMAATWWGLLNTMGKFNKELEQDTKRNWQAVRVYDIINRATIAEEKWVGISFEDIKSKYTEEAVSEGSVNIGKSDLHQDELRRILQDLNTRGLIHMTVDGKYILERRYPPNKSCFSSPNSEIIQKAIIRLLTSESGKVNVSKMVVKVSAEHKLTVEDVYATANCMKTTGAIYVDPQGMVWSALEAPPVNLVKPWLPNELPPKN